MAKTLLRRFSFSILFATGMMVWAQDFAQNSGQPVTTQKQGTIIFFEPEIFPNLEEIQQPTSTAFFSAIQELEDAHYRSMPITVSPNNQEVKGLPIADYCKNNGAMFAIVPKITFFKVGLGKYVFSNQVKVQMKLYDATGKLVTVSEYDTYRRKMRMLGTAENSVKIGTKGALREIRKAIKSLNRAA